MHRGREKLRATESYDSSCFHRRSGNLFTKSRIEDIFARRAVLRHKQRGCFFGKLLQSGQVGRRTFLLTTCQVSREIECVKRFLAICEPDTP